jgi:glucose-6-phosphate-specific signal transduction histidine kinase
MAITFAWENLCQLTALTFILLLAVCTLVYISISRALDPAGVIIAGLENMKQGDLSCRLPSFELIEWQRTATAINQLVSSQQQLLRERQQLALQLMKVQEEERRYLAHELHDELGQCLTAINAVATSIRQTAKQHCPDIVTDANQISRITQHIMDNIRNLLIRLRPADINELGLSASLNSLVSEWNVCNGQDCHYNFTLHGYCAALPEPLPVTLYRIVQECLTNIAKHASATRAQVILSIAGKSLTLTIEDNGIAKQLPLPNHGGMGLLGMRERVTALGGRLMLTIAKPNGLVVQCWLPISSISVTAT